LNAQEGPHSVGYTVAWVSEVFPVAEPYSCTTLRRITRLLLSLTNQYLGRNTL
jgi:hypothetical protein